MTTRSSAATKTRLHLAGGVIMIIGLGIAAWIWLAQDETGDGNAADGTAPMATLDSRKQVRELEIYYGPSAVVFEEFKEWLASLAHGKRLAATIATGALAAGGGCFFAASWLLPRLHRARLNAGAGEKNAVPPTG